MKVVRSTNPSSRHSSLSQWRLCREKAIALENGEEIKRGCGRVGLIPGQVGWSCFYCGNFVYRKKIPLDSLWFHFKTAREYWRGMSQAGNNFVNGVPVAGYADTLPSSLKRDLLEVNPPQWFLYYVLYDEIEFKNYLDMRGIPL